MESANKIKQILIVIIIIIIIPACKKNPNSPESRYLQKINQEKEISKNLINKEDKVWFFATNVGTPATIGPFDTQEQCIQVREKSFERVEPAYTSICWYIDKEKLAKANTVK